MLFARCACISIMRRNRNNFYDTLWCSVRVFFPVIIIQSYRCPLSRACFPIGFIFNVFMMKNETIPCGDTVATTDRFYYLQSYRSTIILFCQLNFFLLELMDGEFPHTATKTYRTCSERQSRHDYPRNMPYSI